MGRRPLKYKTARAYGTRKRKSPMVKKKKSSASITSGVQRTDDVTGSQLRDDDTPSTSTGRTIQAHLEPRFVSPEASQEAAAKVQAKLSAVPATARKMELTGDGEALATTEQTDEFVVVQVTALNALLENAKCQQCSQPGLSVQLGTRFGLAAQLELTCALCGTVAKGWSSPRKEGRRIFDVNLRAIQAVKSIGKGATALNDFWSIMNVSHRRLHHKTFQKHLKSEFRLASETAAAKFFSDAVAAVRTFYSEMDPTFNNNITVVYNGTAAEKDALRKRKAAKALQSRAKASKKPRVKKDTKDYNPGAF
ncbi:uncharacterized protein LOC144096848 [Amblyomma americanum]